MWEATQHLQLLHMWRTCLTLALGSQNQSPCCGYSSSCQVTVQLQSPQAPQSEEQSCGSQSRLARPDSELGPLHSQWGEPPGYRGQDLSCSLHFPSRVPCCALQPLRDGWFSVTSPRAFLHPGAEAVPRSQAPWVAQFLKIGFLSGWHQAIALSVTWSNKTGFLSTTNPSSEKSLSHQKQQLDPKSVRAVALSQG